MPDHSPSPSPTLRKALSESFTKVFTAATQPVLDVLPRSEHAAAKLCMLLSLTVGTVALVSTPLYFIVLRSPREVLLGISYALLTLATPLVLRLSRSLVLTVNYYLMLLTAIILFFCTIMGGIHSSAISCFFVLPVNAVIMLGQRAMFAWIGIVFAIVAGFMIAQIRGVVMFPVVDASLIPFTIFTTFITVLGTVGAVLKIADDNRQRARNLLEEERNIAQNANAELDSSNEKLLQQNNRLAALNDEKNSMMGILAHDLRNPLSQVLFLSDALKRRETLNLNDEDLDRYATMINDGGQRMTNLIQNLLNVHRLENEQTSLSLQDINLVAFLQGAVAQHRTSALAKGIQITIEAPSSPAMIHADETLLTQILDNLLSNAIKYSVHNQPISATITTVNSSDSTTTINDDTSTSSDRNERKDRVVVAISNTGQGIAPEEMPKLFQKFTRLSARPTGNEDSIGLGLAIVRHCVERLQGHIWCESTYGRYATFFVEFSLLKP
jgi:signal transduction histidine kinase